MRATPLAILALLLFSACGYAGTERDERVFTECTDVIERCDNDEGPVCAILGDGRSATRETRCAACVDSGIVGYTEGPCAEDAESSREGEDAQGGQGCGEDGIEYRRIGGGLGCVEPYSAAEARAWPRCSSQADCYAGSCVYVLREVGGAAVEWRGSDIDMNGLPRDALRCAPDDYADFVATR